MARILLTPAAQKDYKRLPSGIRDVVDRLMDSEFRINPFVMGFNIRKVQPPFTGYRLRLGAYRLLFEIAADVILIHRIRHRKDAYR